MAEAARIWTTVGANIAPLKAGLAEAGASSDRFGRTFGAGLASHTRAMERMGHSWQRNVSLPLLATGAIATKMALDFHQQMQLISTSAGGSAKDVKELTGQVLELAKSSPYGPSQLAEGLLHLKKLGYDNVTAMHTLRIAIKGALAGNSDLADTTSALGAAIRTNIKGTGDYSAAMATLNAAAGVGNMRMTDLIAALGTGILPAAKFAGISLKDVGAALALMVDEGMPATQAATRLRMGLTMMEHGSKSANKALSEIHLTTDQLSMMLRSPAGLVGGLTLLKTHLDQLGNGGQLEKWAGQVNRGKMSVEQFSKLAKGTKQFDVLAGAFGGARSSAAILLMLNNLEVLKSKYAQMDPLISKFNQKSQQAANLPLNKLKRDWSDIEANLIKAGDAITPFVVTAAHGLADVTNSFHHLSGSQRTFLEVAAAAAVIGGPLLIFTAKIITALATIQRQFGREAAASTEATAVVTRNMEEQAAAVHGISWRQVDGAWVAEGAASTGATRTVLTNVERQGAAVATLRGELLALTSKAFLITAILSIIPQSKHGANLLDQNHLGFMNHVPLLNRVAQYGALLGSYSPLAGHQDQQDAAAQKRAYMATHPAPQKPVNMTLSYQEWLKLHPSADVFGDAEAEKVYAGYRRRSESKFRAAEQGYKTEVAMYKKGLDKHVSEADRRNELMKKADEQFRQQWAKLFGKSNYTPPNLPGLGGGATATSFALPTAITVMQARADALAATNPNATGPTQLQIQAARAAKAAAMAALAAHGKAWKGAADAWNAVAAANQVLYQQASTQTFTLPLGIQLAQAKADALAALNPNLQGPTAAQIQAAKLAKAAAMKAINSHKLSMDALIAAWGIVQQANGVLAQQLSGQANNYAAVSTRALVQGLGLTAAQKTAIRQRQAQADAHGGKKPTGPAAQGVVIGDGKGHRHHHHHHHHHGRGGGGDVIVNGNVNLHGVSKDDQLYAALMKGPARARTQRAGQR